jgi:microsomal dipeptidase-like Zn-dependent dipeptidase
VFGSDFDGADMPDDFKGLCDMQKVFSDLEKAGIDSDKLYRNAENFLKKMLK